MAKDKPKTPPPLIHPATLYFSVFALGLSILILEILGARLISPYYGSSVYAWSAIITVTLASLAAGYAAGGVLADRNPSPALYFGEIILSGLLVLPIPFIKNPVLSGTSALGLEAGAFASAVLLFAPALIVMSATGPLAIRLATTQLSVMGRGVGKVYAVSTAGSVAGALLAGLVLVPHFSVRDVLLFLGFGVALFGALGLALSGRRGWGGVAALGAVILFRPLLANSTPRNPNILLDKNSFYGEIKVLDSDGMRLLLIDGVGHGVIDVASGESRADYSFYFETLPLFRPEAKRALVIGLGAGIVPEAYRRHHGIVTDAVEIDPVVARAAQDHFGYVPNGAVAVEDGRMFLEKAGAPYDLMVLDAFSSERAPFHLFSREFFGVAKGRLADGGLFAVNTVGNPKREEWVCVYKTLAAVFRNIRVYATDASETTLGNIIFIASDGEIAAEPDLSSLRPLARQMLAGLSAARMPAPDEAMLSRAVLLTDDFNPIDDIYKGTMAVWRKAILTSYKDILLTEG